MFAQAFNKAVRITDGWAKKLHQAGATRADAREMIKAVFMAEMIMAGVQATPPNLEEVRNYLDTSLDCVATATGSW